MELTKEDIKLIEKESKSLRYILIEDVQDTEEIYEKEYILKCNCPDSENCPMRVKAKSSYGFCRKHMGYSVLKSDDCGSKIGVSKKTLGGTNLIKKEPNVKDGFTILMISSVAEAKERESFCMTTGEVSIDSYVELTHKVNAYVTYSPDEGVHAYKCLKRKDKEIDVLTLLKPLYKNPNHEFVFFDEDNIYSFLNNNETLLNDRLLHMMRFYANYCLTPTFVMYLCLIATCPYVRSLLDSGMDQLILDIEGFIMNAKNKTELNNNIETLSKVFGTVNVNSDLWNVYEKIYYTRQCLDVYIIIFELFENGATPKDLLSFLNSPKYYSFLGVRKLENIRSLMKNGEKLLDVADYILEQAKKDNSDFVFDFLVNQKLENFNNYIIKRNALGEKYKKYPDDLSLAMEQLKKDLEENYYRKLDEYIYAKKIYMEKELDGLFSTYKLGKQLTVVFPASRKEIDELNPTWTYTNTTLYVQGCSLLFKVRNRSEPDVPFISVNMDRSRHKTEMTYEEYGDIVTDQTILDFLNILNDEAETVAKDFERGDIKPPKQTFI